MLYVEGKDKNKVEKIRDSKRICNELFYLVKWVRYSEEENTCEPPTNLTPADNAIAELQQGHPEKPSPSNPVPLPTAKKK
jgi:hypothetical protein